MKIFRLASLIAAVLVLAGITATHAQPICVSNALFESPVTDYAYPYVTSWNTIPPQGENDEAIGVFTNDPDFGPGFYIVNSVGTQGAYVFSDTGLTLYQDLNATYTVGRPYQLITGVIGGPQSEENPSPADGAILQMSLYYRDSSNNMVVIASTNIVNTTNLFPDITHYVNCELDIPAVQSTDPWAGQAIGVEFVAIVPDSVVPGGNWDLNNVQLYGTPCFSHPTWSGGQFGATLQSTPGLNYSILATTNLSVPQSGWSQVLTVYNVAGSTPFVDPCTNMTQRFYGARQMREVFAIAPAK